MRLLMQCVVTAVLATSVSAYAEVVSSVSSGAPEYHSNVTPPPPPRVMDQTPPHKHHHKHHHKHKHYYSYQTPGSTTHAVVPSAPQAVPVVPNTGGYYSKPSAGQ